MQLVKSVMSKSSTHVALAINRGTACPIPAIQFMDGESATVVELDKPINPRSAPIDVCVYPPVIEELIPTLLEPAVRDWTAGLQGCFPAISPSANLITGPYVHPLGRACILSTNATTAPR